MNRISPDKVAEYKNLLLDAELRITRHRLEVLEVLASTPGHITANEVLERVRNRYPGVNKTTVYRTLDLLVELGAATMTQMPGGGNQYNPFMYELTELPHHHLICKECGSTIELPNSAFDSLRKVVETQYDFQPCFDHFALYGICKQCR
ncbi:MAG: Fur family transcriptional regulator [Chloroflexia bacterium]